jgi:hypothetical protein
VDPILEKTDDPIIGITLDGPNAEYLTGLCSGLTFRWAAGPIWINLDPTLFFDYIESLVSQLHALFPVLLSIKDIYIYIYIY